ncbi:uncharacterized protein LOC131272569 [Anopheles coustani]|uniref:uncharacterized protein LOC131272569 n=1 Tax=Anopheles coustani TaxID=139045 RepID=UPI00265AF846|nr:uncharacterized protein LOC131272569 [Anopheles coustani]
MNNSTPQTLAVLRVLLRQFRALPELWDAKHKYYGNASRVEAAYANLLKVLHISEPEADVADVFKRLHEFINVFAKEYSENSRSKTRGTCLWYYGELQFLVDAKLVGADATFVGDLPWLRKPPGVAWPQNTVIITEQDCQLEGDTTNGDPLTLNSPTTNMPGVQSFRLEDDVPLSMEVDIKVEDDAPVQVDPLDNETGSLSVNHFQMDPLAGNATVSSGNDSQDSFQSATSISIPPLQADPLADYHTGSSFGNEPKKIIVISRTSPPPLVPRSFAPPNPPKLAPLSTNLPPLAFFKPTENNKNMVEPTPKPLTTKPIPVVIATPKKSNHRSTVFSTHIGTKLTGFNIQQRNVVIDIIKEILLKAEVGSLTMDHVTDIQAVLHDILSAAPSGHPS